MPRRQHQRLRYGIRRRSRQDQHHHRHDSDGRHDPHAKRLDRWNSRSAAAAAAAAPAAATVVEPPADLCPARSRLGPLAPSRSHPVRLGASARRSLGDRHLGHEPPTRFSPASSPISTAASASAAYLDCDCPADSSHLAAGADPALWRSADCSVGATASTAAAKSRGGGWQQRIAATSGSGESTRSSGHETAAIGRVGRESQPVRPTIATATIRIVVVAPTDRATYRGEDMARGCATRRTVLPVIDGGGAVCYSLCSRSTALARRAHRRRECFDTRLCARIDTRGVHPCAGRSTTTAAAANDGV